MWSPSFSVDAKRGDNDGTLKIDSDISQTISRSGLCFLKRWV